MPPAPTVKEKSPTFLSESPALLEQLGPGLITGAADDDPSGIATYSQVGAQFGTAMLWTMLFSFPLMAGRQEICARRSRISGAGIANLGVHILASIMLFESPVCAIELNRSR